jgi:3-deoxy-D-manno-octulosonic-acid transferase
VWIHAVSVGEGAAALPLIRKILERAPETNILVTGGTLAAEEWRRYRYPGSVIRQVRKAAQHARKGILKYNQLTFDENPSRFV